MIDRIQEFFRGKKILILGFGREGKSTYGFLRQILPEQTLYIADRRENLADDDGLKRDTKVVCQGGEKYLDDLAQYEIIMKSPGISFKNVDIDRLKGRIWSQLEVLLKFFEGKTVGVTGTKGKSTTSSLIFQILQDQNIPSMLLGNIGVPVFDMIDEMKSEMILVLEMSSHQLEFMDVSPHIAVLLNVFPEHLDHYRSFEEYRKAKCNIFRYQDVDDVVLFGDEVRGLVVNALGQKWGVGEESDDAVRRVKDEVWIDDTVVYDAKSERKLKGEYNLHNIMFALGVTKVLGLDMSQAARSVNEFETLKHRLEFVGEYDGIKYYDNSIGTVPAATMAAVEALGDVDTLILGGMDRGLDYVEFEEALRKSKIRNVICMPETGWKIAEGLGGRARKVETMEQAVRLAKTSTRVGRSCLLSPAAASYGHFKNFEEKGDLFQELVRRKDL